VAQVVSPAVPEPASDRTKISCTVFRNGKSSDVTHRLDEISTILEEKGSLVWFDAVDPGPNDLDVLKREFNLHPLAIEDAVHAHQRPKIDAYGTYWFLVIQAVTTQDQRVRFHEMGIFAGSNFVVTVRHDPTYPLDEIRERWNAHPEGMELGAGFLLYTILDTVVDGYMPVSETFAERVDDLEERLFSKMHPDRDRDVLPEIFRMKKDGHHFRRAVLPMRDILNPIIRKDLDLFQDADLDYFRDVYDHAILVIDQMDTLRDVVTSALEIHLSVVANRHNEVSKQLTIIATIFLPLTFITGFFGQNFAYLVGSVLNNTWAFWVLGIGTEILALLLTLGYFKRKDWF
jgi:magnesium transporter